MFQKSLPCQWLGWPDLNRRDARVKVWCLTAWLHPKILLYYYTTESLFCQVLFSFICPPKRRAIPLLWRFFVLFFGLFEEAFSELFHLAGYSSHCHHAHNVVLDTCHFCHYRLCLLLKACAHTAFYISGHFRLLLFFLALLTARHIYFMTVFIFIFKV